MLGVRGGSRARQPPPDNPAAVCPDAAMQFSASATCRAGAAAPWPGEGTSMCAKSAAATLPAAAVSSGAPLCPRAGRVGLPTSVPHACCTAARLAGRAAKRTLPASVAVPCADDEDTEGPGGRMASDAASRLAARLCSAVDQGVPDTDPPCTRPCPVALRGKPGSRGTSQRWAWWLGLGVSGAAGGATSSAGRWEGEGGAAWSSKPAWRSKSLARSSSASRTARSARSLAFSADTLPCSERQLACACKESWVVGRARHQLPQAPHLA